MMQPLSIGVAGLAGSAGVAGLVGSKPAIVAGLSDMSSSCHPRPAFCAGN